MMGTSQVTNSHITGGKFRIPMSVMPQRGSAGPSNRFLPLIPSRPSQFPFVSILSKPVSISKNYYASTIGPNASSRPLNFPFQTARIAPVTGRVRSSGSSLQQTRIINPLHPNGSKLTETTSLNTTSNVSKRIPLIELDEEDDVVREASPPPITRTFCTVGVNTEIVKEPCNLCVETKKVVSSCVEKINRLWDTVESFNDEIKNIIESLPPPRQLFRPTRVYEDDLFPNITRQAESSEKAVQNPSVAGVETLKDIRKSTEAGRQVPGNSSTFDCQICSKRFENLSLCQSHERSHNPIPPRPEVSVPSAQCKVCKKSFETQDYLKKHIMAKHKGPRRCQTCERTFKNKHGLNIHKVKLGH